MSIGIPGGVSVAQKNNTSGITGGARNGLTVTSGFVELGGTLVIATEIDADGFGFNITDGADTILSYDPAIPAAFLGDPATQSNFQADISGLKTMIGDTMGVANNTKIQVDDGNKEIICNAGGSRMMTITDVLQLIGDAQNAQQGICVVCDNTNGSVLFKDGGEAGVNFLEFNVNNHFYEFGDLSLSAGGHYLRLDDAAEELIFGVVSSPPRMKVTTNGITLNNNGGILITTLAALTNGAGAAAGTLLNAPTAGNPTKWIAINDAGTTRHIPAW